MPSAIAPVHAFLPLVAPGQVLPLQVVHVQFLSLLLMVVGDVQVLPTVSIVVHVGLRAPVSVGSENH